MERRERTPEEVEAARAERVEAGVEDDAPIAEVAGVPEGVSWTGTIGSGLGVMAMAAIGVTALIEPSEDVTRLVGAPFLLLAVGFLPALWVSIRPSANRQRVLRATVIGCLLTAFASTFVFTTASIAVILMPSSALLAIAAGLIFQGRSQTPAKKKR